MDKINSRSNPLPLPPASPLLKNETPTQKLRVQAEAAAGQFETLMAQQLIHSMQTSLESGSMFGGGVAGGGHKGPSGGGGVRELGKTAGFCFDGEKFSQVPQKGGGGKAVPV